MGCLSVLSYSNSEAAGLSLIANSEAVLGASNEAVLRLQLTYID